MFIRIQDSVNIVNEKNKTFNFLTHYRKGNIAKKFQIKDTKIEFFEDTLTSRKIPKKQISVMQKDIKTIVTEDHKTLIYQDFPEVPCRFIIMDTDDQYDTIEFDELVPGETEILCYDKKLEDYYFSKILLTNILLYDYSIAGATDAIVKKNNQLYKKEIKTLSGYIIGTNQYEGIILNDIMVI